MDFNEQNLKSLLSGKDVGDPLYFFRDTVSTNAVAMMLAEAGVPEGAVVIADSQTKGRGRLRKREWHSPPGLNLYTSIILRPAFDAVLTSPLALVAGVAVAELLSHYCHGRIAVKWPNDVLINGKKACGILAEVKTAGKKAQFVILGIGLNINMTKEALPPHLRKSATSLLGETGAELSRLKVTSELYEQVGKFYKIFLHDGFGCIRDLWHEYAWISGRDVEATFGEETFRGRAVGVDETGALILIDGKGKTRRVIAGDVLPV
jgi:BirA family biotin operon repressor/biotin-[acetyl-CoA-carboxylase] ligase